MLDLALLTAAAAATALVTGLGAVPVFLLGRRAIRATPLMLGVTVGLMGVASLVGLLKPALERGGSAAVAAGLAAGALFLGATSRLLSSRDVHVGRRRGASVRTSLLVFAVLFVHSLPEGLAMGTAYASGEAALGVFVLLAIALQNIPEGTSVAVPMHAAGFSSRNQVWAAIATSAPQPPGAIVAYLLVERVQALLPLSFAFAAGAMLTLIALELAPQAFTRTSWRQGGLGTLAGAALMLALAAVLRP